MMNALLKNSDWDVEVGNAEVLPPSRQGWGGNPLQAWRRGSQPDQRFCPACDSIIYSRRQVRCGVCERELPVELRFNAEQSSLIAGVIASDKQRHRAWLAQRNKASF